MTASIIGQVDEMQNFAIEAQRRVVQVDWKEAGVAVFTAELRLRAGKDGSDAFR